MNFFENTRKPQGFGGKLMTKMMNIGHAKLSQWGFSNISVNPDATVLDVGCGGGANIVAWLGKCGNGYETYNFSGGFRFYDAVANDHALIERSYACGMDY